MQGVDLKSYARSVARDVDAFILRNVSGEPRELYDAAVHLVKAGGKRLRPMIVVAAAEALGVEREAAIPFAAAVEIVHTYTLIHDDIIDEDEVRRGVPAVHKVWGIPLAITAGDMLSAKAFEVMVKARDYGVPVERIVKAVETLSSSMVRVAEGQAMDIMFEDRMDVTLEEYLKMVYLKTGALFEASAALGGLAATDDERVIRSLREYGKCLGIAFQIKDDILGLAGVEEKIGKPVYSDLREGKRTILVIYALSKLDQQGREKLLSVLGRRDATREELEEAAELIKSTGAIEYATSIAEEYANRAKAALSVLPDTPQRRILEELAAFSVKRQV